MRRVIRHLLLGVGGADLAYALITKDTRYFLMAVCITLFLVVTWPRARKTADP